jgi:hypothetical protein
VAVAAEPHVAVAAQAHEVAVAHVAVAAGEANWPAAHPWRGTPSSKSSLPAAVLACTGLSVAQDAGTGAA